MAKLPQYFSTGPIEGFPLWGTFWIPRKRSVLSFNQACLKFDFLYSHPFHFLQAQSYAMHVHRALSDGDWDNILLSKLIHPSNSRGRISGFYLFLPAQINYESRNVGVTKWSVAVPGLTTESILDATPKGNMQ